MKLQLYAQYLHCLYWAVEFVLVDYFVILVLAFFAKYKKHNISIYTTSKMPICIYSILVSFDNLKKAEN